MQLTARARRSTWPRPLPSLDHRADPIISRKARPRRRPDWIRHSGAAAEPRTSGYLHRPRVRAAARSRAPLPAAAAWASTASGERRSSMPCLASLGRHLATSVAISNFTAGQGAPGESRQTMTTCCSRRLRLPLDDPDRSSATTLRSFENERIRRRKAWSSLVSRQVDTIRVTSLPRRLVSRQPGDTGTSTGQTTVPPRRPCSRSRIARRLLAAVTRALARAIRAAPPHATSIRWPSGHRRRSGLLVSPPRPDVVNGSTARATAHRRRRSASTESGVTRRRLPSGVGCRAADLHAVYAREA